MTLLHPEVPNLIVVAIFLTSNALPAFQQAPKAKELYLMTDARVVLTTAANREEAEKIANALVENELAACVNILGPITSIYRWEGAVQKATEILLLIKTWEDAYDRVEATIRDLHSYELPECIALRVHRGSEKYIEWIENSVRSVD
jgi:periplasmic divalent cation tolerance protein